MLLCSLCGAYGLSEDSFICKLCGNIPGKSNSKWNKKVRQEIFNQATTDPSDGNECHINLYEKYNPFNDVHGTPKCIIEKRHPTELMESAVLHSIKLPKIEYSNDVSTEGLSNCQIETVCYILHAFDKNCNDDERMGFFLGDGTGCGKGRTIASLFNTLSKKGLIKHVWISVSQDLRQDAERDLNDVSSILSIQSIHDNIEDTNIVFMTYANLISTARYDQLCEWLGDAFEGCIVFDEAHKGKQCMGAGVSKTYVQM